MANLVLELKPGEMMVINGASIRFRSRSRIELASRARFLFGKQIMAPQEARSPARRIYYALQNAYVGTDAERGVALSELDAMIAMFREATTSATAASILDAIMHHVRADEYYLALKLGRRIIRHEDAVLQAASADAGSPPDGAGPPA